MDLIYKRSNTMYLKILASKYQAFVGNRQLKCYFPSEHSICQFYHSHHLWLHHCCWLDHSLNSWHKQLELLILLFEEYGYKQSFSKSILISISDSVRDERDLLEDILANKMIRKLNLILLLILW